MPDLVHSLDGQDLGYLRIVADLWGIELNAPDSKTALPLLIRQLTNQDSFSEIMDSLPVESVSALNALFKRGGKFPWAQFTREFGVIRDIGPGRRDRLKPYLDLKSPSERLWYMGLIGRAFFDTPGGPQEVAYIPDEFLDFLKSREHPIMQEQHLIPAPPSERSFEIPANARILDDACTYLSTIRLGQTIHPDLLERWRVNPQILHPVLQAAGIINDRGELDLEEVKRFLEMPRGEALAWLVTSWRGSIQMNELQMMPEFIVEGEWKNNPLQGRNFILDQVTHLDPDRWYRLDDLVHAIYVSQPDFQRPAGDYDSWFIRDAKTGETLRGFERWYAVEGLYIRFLLCKPMHWLGLIDLAATKEGAPPSCFRLSGWSKSLAAGAPPPGFVKETKKLGILSDGRLIAPRLLPRAVRYQIGRFCELEMETEWDYKYRITPGSLERARDQGLRLDHLIGLLSHHTSAPVPPTLFKALKRWKSKGVEARFEHALVLRVTSPGMLKQLRESKAARFLGDPLGPTTIIVKSGAMDKVIAAIAELGFLASAVIEELE